MQVITNQIFILGIAALIGYIAFKLKVITPGVSNALVKIITKITLPLLILTSISGIDTNPNTLLNGIVIFLGAPAVILILFGISSITGRLLKLNLENYNLHRVQSMFGNVVFLGFPLMDALIPGGKGLLYALIFQLGNDLLLWTWGIILLNKAGNKKTSESWKHLLNPITISFVIGFILYLLSTSLPPWLHTPLAGIGHTTIYLSMLYIGAILAQVKLKTLLRNLRAYILSLNKLLIGPILIGMIILALKSCGLQWLEDDAFIVLIMQAGMPGMVLISVLARDMGLNDFQATQNIFVSTLLSLFSLPFLYYLLHNCFLA